MTVLPLEDSVLRVKGGSDDSVFFCRDTFFFNFLTPPNPITVKDWVKLLELTPKSQGMGRAVCRAGSLTKDPATSLQSHQPACTPSAPHARRCSALPAHPRPQSRSSPSAHRWRAGRCRRGTKSSIRWHMWLHLPQPSRHSQLLLRPWPLPTSTCMRRKLEVRGLAAPAAAAQGSLHPDSVWTRTATARPPSYCHPSLSPAAVSVS